MAILGTELNSKDPCMSVSQTIPIHPAPAADGVASVGNATPILHEIRHALMRLLEDGETTIIDLRAIPFGPGDQQRLLEALGTGEVTATVDTLGVSEVRETGYPGVWLVDHADTAGERVALQVEVTAVPAILTTQQADMRDALVRLDAKLRRNSG